MSRYCSMGKNLRQEYLVALNELVSALKEHGKLDPKTEVIAGQSEIARQAWEDIRALVSHAMAKSSSLHRCTKPQGPDLSRERD